MLITAPPGLGGGRAAVIAVAWSGDLEEGERAIAPLWALRGGGGDAGRLQCKAVTVVDGPDHARGPGGDDVAERGLQGVGGAGVALGFAGACRTPDRR